MRARMATMSSDRTPGSREDRRGRAPALTRVDDRRCRRADTAPSAHLVERRLRASGRTPAVSSSSTVVSKPSAGGVERGRPDAVVGGDARPRRPRRRRARAASAASRSPFSWCAALEAGVGRRVLRPCGTPPRSGRWPGRGGTRRRPCRPRCAAARSRRSRAAREVGAGVDVEVLGGDHVIPAVRRRGEQRRRWPTPRRRRRRRPATRPRRSRSATSTMISARLTVVSTNSPVRR